MVDFNKTISNIAEYLCNPANRDILESIISESILPFETEPLENMSDESIKQVCLNKFSKGCLVEE